MKKRTLLAGTLMAASLAHANAEDTAKYIKENTGANQKGVNELCLKVDTMTISSIVPGGKVSSMIFGLRIAAGATTEQIVAVNYQTKQCEEGYIKISTTANLVSIRNAPVGL